MCDYSGVGSLTDVHNKAGILWRLGTLHGCQECAQYFVQHSILRYSSIFRDLDIDVLFPKNEISLSWK